MKKSTIIILFGLACLLLIGFIAMQWLDIAEMKKTTIGLVRERDLAKRLLKTREDEIASLKQRMRSLEDSARNAEGRLANFKETVKNLEEEPVNTANQEDELDRWLGRIVQLRNYLKRHPEYAISEFKYLTDEDWLSVTRSQMESEADYRKKLAILRQEAMLATSKMLRQAISDFTKANNGSLPRNFESIKNYLPEDFDYTRYTNNSSGKTPYESSATKTQQWIIKDAGPVDNIWDSGIWVSAQGGVVFCFFTFLCG